MRWLSNGELANARFEVVAKLKGKHTMMKSPNLGNGGRAVLRRILDAYGLLCKKSLAIY